MTHYKEPSYLLEKVCAKFAPRLKSFSKEEKWKKQFAVHCSGLLIKKTPTI